MVLPLLEKDTNGFSCFISGAEIEQLTSLVSFSKRGSKSVKKENFIRETCKNIVALDHLRFSIFFYINITLYNVHCTYYAFIQLDYQSLSVQPSSLRRARASAGRALSSYFSAWLLRMLETKGSPGPCLC